MTAATINDDLKFLCDAHWDDPEAMEDDDFERVKHVPVHVFRHRKTGELHVILVEDDGMQSAPTYIVEEDDLFGVLPGKLVGGFVEVPKAGTS